MGGGEGGGGGRVTIRPRRGTFTSSTPRMIRAIGITGETYHNLMSRRGGVTARASPAAIMRTNTTAIGASWCNLGQADSPDLRHLRQYLWHLNYITHILGTDRLHPVGALSLMDPRGRAALHRGHPGPSRTPPPNRSPRPASAPHVMCAASASSPNIALCAHSSFGNLDYRDGAAERMPCGARRARRQWTRISPMRAR